MTKRIDLYNIPEFLKPHKGKEEKTSKFCKLLDEYEKKFEDSPPTEPSTFSEEEWCTILEKCIKKGIKAEEFLGIEYGEDIDY